MADNLNDKETLAHDCAHAVCNCTVAAHETFCSAYCENAPDAFDLACACGHPACQIEAKVIESPTNPV